jgi:predicted permease
VWLPISVTPQVMATDWRNAPKASWLVAMARLKPGVSRAQARAAFEAIAHQLDGPVKYGIEVNAGSRGIAELQAQFSNPLYVLMAVVALVLLIACCNLANLLMARAASRSHEIGVRLAIGASRGRVMRQLLCESLLLSAIGAGIALAFASWASTSLVKLAMNGKTLEVSSIFDGRVLGFAVLITGLATCLFSISPAWLMTRDGLNAILQRRTRSGRIGPARSLAVAEIAISCLLLAGSSMLVRSLWALRHQDFGFRTDNILLVDLPWEFNPAMMARYKALMQPLYDHLNQLPGVQSAALSGFGPMGGDQHTGAIASAGRVEKVRIVHVSPRYFETMQTSIVQGRAIMADDRDGEPEVAVLSQTAARIVFGGANPVGQSITEGDKFDGRHAIRIVGVARDVRFASPGEPFGSMIYVPMAQSPAPITTLSIRTLGDPASVARSVQTTLHSLEAGMAIGSIRPLSDALDAKLSHERLLASVATAFGLLALALTTVGVYGVIAYGVQRRVREIGIRLALGATRSQVTRALMTDVGIVVIAGTTAGLIGAIAVTRALRSMLFAFGTTDYLLLAGAVIFLVLIAALAGYFPARRAARLDPMTALGDV